MSECGHLSTDGNMTSTRAKIVCTMGPATRDIETIRELIKAGMNVARLNFSHGYHDEHREMMGNIRQAAQELGAIVGIMVDLQGPKIRVRRFVHGQITLTAGQRITITTRNVMGDEQHVSTFYEQLPQDLKPGDRVLLDDGLIVLQVVETTPEDVVSEVVVGGVLKDNKGINVPHAALSAEAVTRKDRADLEFAMQEGADYVAMSFVRSPADVRQLRGLMHERSADIPIINVKSALLAFTAPRSKPVTANQSRTGTFGANGLTSPAITGITSRPNWALRSEATSS